MNEQASTTTRDTNLRSLNTAATVSQCANARLFAEDTFHFRWIDLVSDLTYLTKTEHGFLA
jgi:hypothetical protein